MQENAQIQLRLVNDRIATRIREASDARLIASRTSVPTRSVRRTVGHSIIRIGERLAAEPHFQPARPR